MRIVALDLIRFFAAMSVVLYHYISRAGSDAYPMISEVTKFGYLGVPLFFIVSGYVIALSANGRTALQFGISRFVRLYPALWIGVIFTVVIMTTIGGKQYSATQIFANFTLINEYLGFDDIDGVYWTLKTELKFYACIFLLLALRFFHRYHVWLSLWVVFTAMYTFFDQPFFMGWFISPGYSPYFIAGIAFYLIQKTGGNTYNHSIIFLSLILASVNAYTQTSGFITDSGTWEKLISVAFIWLFFVVMLLLVSEKLHLRESKFILTLGALTYPLYLIHNVAGKAIIDHFTYAASENLIIFLTITAMLIMSWAIHSFFEKPLATPLKNYLLVILNNKTLKENN